MEKNIEILQELREISPLLSGFENKNPYSLPFSYFSSLAGNTLEKIRTGAEPYYHFTKETPYAVPVDYFANLPLSITQKIKDGTTQSEVFAEMEEVSPLLNTISKNPVYTVPGGYFEVEWSKGEIAKNKAKVTSFGSARKLLRYAVAAIIIGVLAVGLFLFIGKDNTTSQADTAKAASEVKKLTEQEIVDYLKTNPAAGSVVVNSSNTNNDGDIKNVVSKMSDKEIQRFLEETAEQDEM